MIVTLTPNPSHDRTVTLAAPLERGAVQRAESVTSQAGGKGVNISRASVAAGISVVSAGGGTGSWIFWRDERAHTAKTMPAIAQAIQRAVCLRGAAGACCCEANIEGSGKRRRS